MSSWCGRHAYDWELIAKASMCVPSRSTSPRATSGKQRKNTGKERIHRKKTQKTAQWIITGGHIETQRAKSELFISMLHMTYCDLAWHPQLYGKRDPLA